MSPFFFRGVWSLRGGFTSDFLAVEPKCASERGSESASSVLVPVSVVATGYFATVMRCIAIRIFVSFLSLVETSDAWRPSEAI